MKHLVIILFAVLLFTSCSDDKNSAIESISEKICSKLQDNPTSEGIKEAGDIFYNEFASKFTLNEKELSDYLVKLRPCFARMGFSKEIKPADNYFTGAVSKYLALKEDGLKIVLKNENAPAFSVDMIFTGIKKYLDSAKPEIKGKFILLDKDKNELAKYNIYPVPDFYLTLEKGSGDFKFTVYLDAIWYPYGEKPFDKAIEYLELMHKAEFYAIVLDFEGNKKSKEDEDNDDEILDNLQILSAPSN